MSSSDFFARKRRCKSPTVERLAKGWLTEDQLGWNVSDACDALGWKFYWLRKTINSSEGILDCIIVPVHHRESRKTLFRELKGHDARGRLGKPTPAQVEAIHLLTAAGEDAAVWTPADWFSDKIIEELT